MKTKKFISYVLVVLCMTLFSCATEEIDSRGTVTIKVTNNLGSSTGDVVEETNGESLGKVTITLGKKRIKVAKEELGKVSLVSETTPIITETTDSAGRKVTTGRKNFSYSDTQTADAFWKYLSELLAKYNLQIADVEYINYKSELISDNEAQITYMFDVIAVPITEGSGAKIQRFSFTPWYFQYVNEEKVDDTPIVTTDDQIGGSTADVTASKAAFTAKAWLKLAQTSITVPKELFGKVSLSQTGTPQSTAITKTDSIGEQITFTDKFADSQSASVTLRNAHSKKATFYYSITSLQYVDYTATAVNDKTYLITIHYRGNYVHSNGSKRGTFDLYPKYYQILKEEPAQLTWKVDSTYTTLSDGSMIWYGKLTRSDGIVKEKRDVLAFVGDVHGRNVFGVSEAKVIKKNDSHKKHSEKCTTETDGNWTITTDYETWRWERFFANPQNKDLTAETEIVFWTKQLTFKDPETGWTLTTKPLVKNCEIIQDEIINEEGAPRTATDEHGRTGEYVSSHNLIIKNTLDGNFFHTSTATSRLYRWK